ncbi:ESPR domain-containing protein [Moraxella sp.]|uniref:ESPR domain-containing protein n=1 Tax=Moraxella sp. TaxID=479 RepID=UPI0026DCE2E9|nr:ESPR domain-containing protein [Moraxella sp.]MDO4894374.1 ESPR domain-containing protein [Moraxella sp.]
MNRLCYRVIFNKSLDRLVVTSEKTRSTGKSNNPSVGGKHQQQPNFFGLNNVTVSGMGFGLKSLSCALFLGFASLVNYSQANTAFQTPIPTIIADQTTLKSLICTSHSK